MTESGNSWISLSAISSFLSVALGAFAAHGLSHHLEPKMIEVFQTGAHYQMTHSLALFMVGLGLKNKSLPTSAQIAAWGFAIGILFFSGSLYILALSGITAWGALTPIGGLCFLFSWFWLAWISWRKH